jgi:N-acetylmuramic acid 6-phosphate etherase
MVNLHTKNKKLAERAVGIVEEVAGLDDASARQLLAAAGERVSVALVMAKAGVSREQALSALKKSGGRVRQAITTANIKKPIRKNVTQVTNGT